MDAKVTARERLATNIMVAGIGALILWDSASLTGASAYFPVAVGVSLIAFSAISAINQILRTRDSARTSEASLIHGLAGLALLGLFVASASAMGFLTSALWFLPAMAMLGGERHGWRVVLITLLFTLLAWLLFHLVFAQSMPPEFIFGEVR
ncbi:hypothetical protein F0A17_11860 [Billgrantia pellis]|uniref:DUF1468 domain-containing protein n=1 Tax=Billgrantia pellis TaxID=2606936 RepID=A0A7V7FZ73_9GAMM|nr:tripartite tricarboxylate transporter TctB family protein [Halomonas pellis]KAA0011988.1 hypothetical protein F0A17_11860 [Halomonas pellis]